MREQKIKIYLVFIAAIIQRLLNPVEFYLSTDILEFAGIITLCILCVYGIKKDIFKTSKPSWFERMCFGIYAFFSTLAYIYSRELSLLDMNLFMGIYCCLGFITNYHLAQYGYQLIKELFNAGQVKAIKTKYIGKQVGANNFWFYFGCLFITYLFFLIINYPGNMMYDPIIQIMQIYKIPNITTDQVNLINPEQFITTHHPFAHTMMIKFFLSIGELVGSLDVGIFLYSLFQITITALAIACLLKNIHPYFTNRGVLNWLMLFSFSPIVLMYTGLMTKDTIFAVFFALFALKFYEYIKDNTQLQDKKWTASFVGIILICSLFRNNFFYAALMTFIILLIIKKDKRLLKTTALYLCIYLACTNILIPALGVTKGSIREVISVPFQQTANYVSNYGATDEEKEVISKILDYKTLEAHLDPEVSNFVKNTYNKNATTEDLIEYFKTWAKMFWKHPDAYFDAYFNQFYGYFSTKPYYPAAYNLDATIEARKVLIEQGINLSKDMPFMSIKKACDILLTIYCLIPMAYLTTNSGIYIWIILAAIAILLRNKNKNMILFYLPFLLYFATLLLSPANASIEYRYMFPYLIALPILMAPVRSKREMGQIEPATI